MDTSFRYTQADLVRKIEDIVAEARLKFSLPVSFTAAECSQAMGLELVFGPTGGPLGLIHDRRIIVRDDITSRERVNFTIYHEIMHFLIDEDADLVDFLTDLSSHNHESYQYSLERFCDIGAAEFMLPRKTIQGIVNSKGFSVDRVPEISRSMDASLVATAIQLGVLAPTECYVLICNHGMSRQGRLGLYVDICARPESMPYPLARYTQFFSEHELSHVYRTGERYEGPSHIVFGRSGRRMEMAHTEALRHANRVIAIMYWKRKPGSPQSGQLPLLL